MLPNDTNGKDDPHVLGLLALGWLLQDQRRADRLLAMTGLDSDALRAGANEPAILDAVLAFLENHEPDLVSCAEDLGCSPSALVAARQELDA